MRLFRPNPGEIVDRQTILQLKAEAGSNPAMTTTDETDMPAPGAIVTRKVMHNASKVNIQPFLDESEMCQQALEKNWFDSLTTKDKQDAFDTYYNELLEVNRALWKLEDRARILKAAPDKFQDLANKSAAEVLFSITDLNDQRAEIVKKINSLWGITAQEKMYA